MQLFMFNWNNIWLSQVINMHLNATVIAIATEMHNVGSYDNKSTCYERKLDLMILTTPIVPLWHNKVPVILLNIRLYNYYMCVCLCVCVCAWVCVCVCRNGHKALDA